MKKNDVEIVPFHEAEIVAEKKTFRTAELETGDGRTVCVGLADDGDRGIWIERPLDDRRRSQLAFGMTRETALHLLALLHRSFEIEELEAELKKHPNQ